MPKPRVWFLLLSLVLLACGSEQPEPPKPPEFTQAFSNLPLPPNAEFVSRGGGPEALQITLTTPVKEPDVSNYYRSVLTKGKWRLVSDIKGTDHVTVLYAEHDGPPLWVRIWPMNDSSGTMVQLTGAAIRKDSTGQSGSSMSTKRSHRG
jgi:hypothetical protein